MPQDMTAKREINIVGAGIAGTWQALLFAEAGFRVTLHEAGDASLASATSHWAGGMLAPDCEADGAEPIVLRLGSRALDLWKMHAPEAAFEGSLVVAHPRDRADFERFARITPGHRRLNGDGIATLEPGLGGRFGEALFFPREGHVEPRKVLPALHERLTQRGVTIRYGSAAKPEALDGTVIDCRGMAARDIFPDLRGVKGETVTVETAEVALKRPVRLIHPRWPIYIIPRNDNRYLIGATTIETEDNSVSVRATLELLSAAYAVHPAFAEAQIVEIGAGLRPAFPDNAPRIRVDGERIAVNGLYRHGFLIAPALAETTVNWVLNGQRDNEVMQWS